MLITWRAEDRIESMCTVVAGVIERITPPPIYPSKGCRQGTGVVYCHVGGIYDVERSLDEVVGEA